MSVPRIIPLLPRTERRRVLRPLVRLRRRTRDALLARRARIVELYIEGSSTGEIGSALGCAPATCVRVLHRYRDGGLDGLRDGRESNGLRKLDEDVLQALAEILERSPEDSGWPRPTWTQELLAKELERRTGISLCRTSICRALRKIGARWGMPKPVVACPWPRARKQRRIRSIRRTLRQLPPNEIAFYVDEVDVHLNPKVGRDWMLRGQQRRVLTPGKNAKRYLAGALAADGSDLIVVESDKKTTDLFLRLLNAMLHELPWARRIHLILDNYCIHSSRAAKTYLAHADARFKLHFLPPYSPDQNRIERLWRELHANVTRNHRCTSIRALMAAVHRWLRRQRRARRFASHQLLRSRRRAA